jgi:sensor histidine kinase YesM
VCFTQDNKIDSLNRILPTLHDTAKVDCLNNLTYQYILAEKKDAADFFADKAQAAAKQINYANGIAVSIACQAHIVNHFHDDFIKSETLCKEAMLWFDKTGNKKGIESLYTIIIVTAFAQSKFDDAMFYAQKLNALAHKSNQKEKIVESISWMYIIHLLSGNFEKALLYIQQVYELAVKEGNKPLLSKAIHAMARLYQLIEDYQTSLNYYRQLYQLYKGDEEIRKQKVKTGADIWFKMEFAEVFSQLGQFDSAWYYYGLFKPSKEKDVYQRVYLISTGECLFLQKNYMQALQNFRRGLEMHLERNDRNEIMRSFLDIAKTYLALGNNREALEYGRKGLIMALHTRAKHFIRDGYQVLSTVYDNFHQADSANFYFRKYVTMKDSVLNDQAKGKLAAYNYEQKIALVNKEKEIHQAALESEAIIKRVLVISILVLFILGVFIIRFIMLKRRNEKQQMAHEMEMQKHENERDKVYLLQQASELKMQALQAQMNPHFIFNSLNAINRFILQNNKFQASEYLTKFSQLTRLILQNSQASLIPLENELEALKHYFELETLRFDHHFDYSIVVDPAIDVSMTRVPPLLIQPYAENAIWHGLMHKQEKGHLSVMVLEAEGMLCCKIIDNGIGRKRAAELKSKTATAHKSLGTHITANRISMLQEKEEAKGQVIFHDLVLPDGSAGGTEVTLKIPLLYA